MPDIHDRTMPAQLRRSALGRADARRIATALAAELRSARVSAAISQATAARAAGISRAQWGRLERNEEHHPDIVELCAAGRALGLELSARYHLVGSPVRDRAQLALLDRLEQVIAAPLRMRREVPLPIPGDLRAWDSVIDAPEGACFVEGESRLGDAQAVERRMRLKQRDDPRASVVILAVARTHHNRAVLQAHREALRDFLPLDGPAIFRALRAGRRPSASGIVLV